MLDNISFEDKNNNHVLWKCDNIAYLTFFLGKYYGGVDLDKPSEIYYISENEEKRVYFFNGEKKVIYKLRSEGEEYFTNSTLYLHKATCYFDKKEFDEFIIHFNSGIVNKVTISIEFLNQYINMVAKILGIRRYKKIKIYLISKEVIKNLFRTEAITGFFDPLKCKIYIDSLDIHVTHEIIHALMHEWGIWTNLFCYEGIAEAFKKPIELPVKEISRISSFSDIFFTWETLSNEKYGKGGLFFRFLFEMYGTEKVKMICCIVNNNENIEEIEEIIKSKCNPNIISEFRTWYNNKNWDVVDWYFQNTIKERNKGGFV